MGESGDLRAEAYFDALRRALEGGGPRAAQILEEVRSDFSEHVRSHLATGHSEEESVRRALEGLGDPTELAFEVRRELPPQSVGVVSALRYLGAAAVILWTLLMVVLMRTLAYGAEGVQVLGTVMLFHLPVVLLLWPRIVWRKNWLFAPILGATGLAVVLLAATVGTPSPQTGTISMTAAEVVVDPSDSHPQLVPVALGLLAVAALLLLAMQQRAQRRRVVVACLVVFAGIETAFQVEEAYFRRDVQRVKAHVASLPPEFSGRLSRAELERAGLDLTSGFVAVREYGEDFRLYWPRPLRGSSSIHYSSPEGAIVVQD